jgi:hypothetical protein
MHPVVSLAVALALSQAEAEPQEGVSPAGPSPTEVPAPAPAAARPRRPRAEGDHGGTPAGLGPSPAASRPAEPERTQVARAALAFLDPLLAGDPVELSRASAERFSFDGDVRTGRDEIRRTFRALLDARGEPWPVLLDLEVLPASDALARLGPPPPRLASLASARGSWVAIANVSRRPVVLFLTREGNRWVVAGMHG